MIPDVRVVGGGAAGCLAALAARRLGLRVELLAPNVQRPDFAQTTSARFEQALDRLGALGRWQEWTGPRATPKVVSRWGTTRSVTSDNFLRPDLSLHVVNRRASDAFLQTLALDAGVIVTSERWTPRTQAFRTVDATGRTCAVARRRGARRRIIGELIGVSGWSETHGADHVEISALPDGWLYSAPAPCGRTNHILFTAPAVLRRAGVSRIAATLMAALRNTSGNRSLPLQSGSAQILLASPTFLEEPGGSDWIAVGEAAVAFDPLAGAGLAFAAESALRAAAVLAGATELPAYAAFVQTQVSQLRIGRHRLYGMCLRAFPTEFWRGQVRLPLE